MTDPRVIKTTPCQRPTHHNATRCPGNVTWTDTGTWLLGTCTTCHHDYTYRPGPYERHQQADP